MTTEYQELCKKLMSEMGDSIKRWSNDSNPIISQTFKDCIITGGK